VQRETKIIVMIKNLITQALKSEGADLLKGFGLSGDKQGKAIDLAKDNICTDLQSR